MPKFFFRIQTLIYAKRVRNECKVCAQEVNGFHHQWHIQTHTHTHTHDKRRTPRINVEWVSEMRLGVGSNKDGK